MKITDIITESEKIKGADGKACWKGKRYAGTKNGKDICIPVKEQDMEEGRAIIRPEDGVAAIKKLYAYVNRNLTDLASNAAFEADRKQAYYDERFEGFLTKADGTKVTPIFNLGGGLELVDTDVLSIPVGMYYRYPGMASGGVFVNKLLTLLGYKQAGVAEEAANPAQQAAIAIAMKKKGQTPKNEAEGTPEGLPHLTKELVQHILEQVKTEGPHAICKSIEWGDGAADELLEYIVQSLEQWEPQVDEDWQKANKHDKTDGMSRKAVKAYRREHPGSKLQTAVTTKPSKLKAGSKDAKRRKSFCARMSGNPGPMKDEKGRPTPKAKALRRWNCE